MDEEAPGLGEADAAGAHVEQHALVELADRRAVLALHVVGEDLELGLRVDERLLREEEVLVLLDGVGLLRAGADDDAAVEDRAGAAVEHALVELAARAVRLRVVDGRVVVHVLLARDLVEAEERAVGAFAAEADAQVVPREAGAERDRVVDERGVGGRAHVQALDVERLGALALHLGEVEGRPGRQVHPRDGIHEVGAARGPQEAFHDHGPRAFAEGDRRARVHHVGVAVQGREVEDVDGAVELDTVGEPDRRAIPAECQVERRKGVVGDLPLGRGLEVLAEAADRDALGKVEGRERRREAAVDEGDLERLQGAVGQAGELIGVRGAGGRLERDLGERRHVGEAPGFLAPAGEAERREALDRPAAQVRKSGQTLRGPLEVGDVEVPGICHGGIH